MLSTTEIILEYVCPAAGLLCANWMFAAPLADVRKASHEGHLGSLNPTPWAVMTGNTLGWCTYGLLQQNWFIFLANAPGFFLSLYFNLTAIKLLYSAAAQSNSMNKGAITNVEERGHGGATGTSSATVALLVDHKKVTPEENVVTTVDSNSIPFTEPPSSRSMTCQASIPVPLCDAPATQSTFASPVTTSPFSNDQSRLQSHERLFMLMIALWMAVVTCIVSAKAWDEDIRIMVVGVTVNCNLVFFYGAPLSTIRQVWRTRSSAALHGPTMLRNTANGVFWTIYGMAVLDPFVAVPNGLGALLGVIQMILWVIFPRKPQVIVAGPETAEPVIDLAVTASEP